LLHIDEKVSRVYNARQLCN